MEGTIEVACQWCNDQKGEDRKIDQIMLELYNVSVRALQWFGDEVYEVDDSVLMIGGCPAPAGLRSPVHGGEGMELVPAWCPRSGSLEKWWKTWCSRCLPACWELESKYL